MSNVLTQALAEHKLQPGECQRVQVNGYQLEIRRPAAEESEFGELVMFDAWTALPQGEPAVHLPLRIEAHPLPFPPDIPAMEDDAQ